jgi:hypothetical protein
LRVQATDEEILVAVEAWIDDLARGDYVAAFARTEHDAYYAWTPELIEAVINGYGLAEPLRRGVKFTVTPRADARGRPHYREVDRDVARDSTIAEVWYDLPINGEWSDLTATFRVDRKDLALTLVLQEIHVF